MSKKFTTLQNALPLFFIGVIISLFTSCVGSRTYQNDGVYYDPTDEDAYSQFGGSYFTDEAPGNSSQSFVEADEASDLYVNNDAFNYVSPNNTWYDEPADVTINNYYGSPGYYGGIGMNPYAAFNPYSGWYTYAPGFSFNMGWNFGFGIGFGLFNPYYNPYNWNWGYGYPMSYYGMYSPYYGPSYGSYYGGGGYYGCYPNSYPYGYNSYDVYGRRSTNVVQVNSSNIERRGTTSTSAVDVTSPTTQNTVDVRRSVDRRIEGTSPTVNESGRTIENTRPIYRSRTRSTSPTYDNSVSPRRSNSTIRNSPTRNTSSPRIRNTSPTRSSSPSKSTPSSRSSSSNSTIKRR